MQYRNSSHHLWWECVPLAHAIAHFDCSLHVRDRVLQHHNEVLPKLTRISTRLKVWGDVEPDNHVQSKRGGEFELERRQLKVEDHIGEERALLGGMKGELGGKEESFSSFRQMASKEGFRRSFECTWRGVRLVREGWQGAVVTSRPTLQR